MGDVLHIGDVARLLDLSLKTIRHWDEIGLAVPSGRSRGGFRLYTRADVARLAFIKRFRPVGFGLEETRRVIAALDGLAEPPAPARPSSCPSSSDSSCRPKTES
jgi:DNA-binding transcriptional MerR regulator